jgi:hypothetical protein
MSFVFAGKAQYEIGGAGTCIGGKPLGYPGNGPRINGLPAP